MDCEFTPLRLFYDLELEMKRMWLWVAVAIVVGVLILGATKGKWCGKAKKMPYGYTEWNPIWDDVGPPPPPSSDPTIGRRR